MEEGGADVVRESQQLEKLKALKSGGDGDAPREKRKDKKDGKGEAKAFGKNLTEEVDDRVRNGDKPSGTHCDALVGKADEVARQDKTSSSFQPSVSSTPLEVYVTVSLKAKTLKRVLAKVAVLADVCHQRGYRATDNVEVHHDAKPHYRAEIELVLSPEQIKQKGGGGGRPKEDARSNNGAVVPADGGKKLPILKPIGSGDDEDERGGGRGEIAQKLLQDGSVFKGEMRDGKPHGFGSVTYSETDPKQRVRFAGEFEDGTRKGLGCLVWKDGAQYAGEWYGDKPSGFGVENYPDGSSYGGQYEDDMRHGYGTYTFPSGAKYEGCWLMGKRHGRALEQSKKGVFMVEFDNNKRVNQQPHRGGEDEQFDLLLAKVRAAVDKGAKSGLRSIASFEKHFETKLRR